MKYALSILICTLFAGYTQAQAIGSVSKTYSSQEEKTQLKVVLTKTGMTVTFMDQPVTIGNIQILDSLVKKIPDPKHSKIEFESQNADRDQSIAIIRILEKCECRLTTKNFALKE